MQYGVQAQKNSFVMARLGRSLLLMLIAALSMSLPPTAHAWSGRVFDKETGEPIEGVVVTRGWDREYATVAGTVSSDLKNKEGFSDAEGRFAVPRFFLYVSIPFFADVTEDRPAVYKPGYRYLETDGHPSKIFLEKVPTLVEVRRDELHHAESALSFDSPSPLLRQITEREDEFLTAATHPARKVVRAKPRKPIKSRPSPLPEVVPPPAAVDLVDKINRLMAEDDPQAVAMLIEGLKADGTTTALQKAMKTGTIVVKGVRCEKILSDFIGQQIANLDRDLDARPAATKILTRLGPVSVAPLLAFIADKDRVIAEGLRSGGQGRGGGKSYGHALRSVIWVRARAFAVLGSLDDPIAEGYLLTVGLGDSDSYVREQAAKALTAKGERINPALVKALQHPDWKFRHGAAVVLRETGTLKELPALLAATADSNAEVAVAATLAAGGLRAQLAIPALRRLVGHNESRVRKAALRALWETDEKAAFEPLRQAFDDEDSHVRQFAVEALGGIGYPSEGSLNGPPLDSPKYGALQMPNVPKALSAALTNPFQDVRDTAAAALVQLRAAEMARGALDAADPYLRWRGAWMLGEMGDWEAVELLVPLLQDRAPEVRWMAARALGQIGDQRAGEPLRQLLNDPDSGLRARAQESLAQLKSRDLASPPPVQGFGPSFR